MAGSLKPYYQDDTITLHHGDALTVARVLPDRSVDCIVTSPPYYGLRDYGQEGQYGQEESPAEYVATMCALFAELRRVLTDDGTFWLNLGDSYSGGRSGQTTLDSQKKLASAKRGEVHGMPAKNLLGIPWRVAFALQDDGWILRNSIVWNKPNAMPESVTDRLSCRYESLFLFTKSERYHFDLDPIREELIYPDAADGSRVFGGKNKAADLQTGSSARRTGGTYGRKPTRKGPNENWNNGTGLRPHTGYRGTHEAGKNPGDVWVIPTQPFAGAHFATMPKELARRCIVAGCKPLGTVMDPFSGSGTTGLVAQDNGRKYIGIDLSRDYLDLSLKTRLNNGTLDLGI